MNIDDWCFLSSYIVPIKSYLKHSLDRKEVFVLFLTCRVEWTTIGKSFTNYDFGNWKRPISVIWEKFIKTASLYSTTLANYIWTLMSWERNFSLGGFQEARQGCNPSTMGERYFHYDWLEHEDSLL